MTVQLKAMRNFALLLLFSFLVNESASTNTDQKTLVDSEYSCIHPPYRIHIFSTSPLVIYISDFITPSERAHLLSVTKNTFSDSAVADESGAQGLRSTRTSKSTTVPPDSIVNCISERALSFQSLSIPPSHLEPLQLVRYTHNQSYNFHTDWFPSLSAQTSSYYGGNRASSFFAYISASEDLLGGGTNFPLLDAPLPIPGLGEEGNEDGYGGWCRYVDCDEEWENGVTFRAVEGNAVFWRNLREDGSGDDRTLHKGVRVERGEKVGMNIWTREGPLSAELRGGS